MSRKPLRAPKGDSPSDLPQKLALEGETPLFDMIEEVAVTSISTMRQRPTLAPRLVLIQPNACSICLMFANARADGIAAVPDRSPVNRRAAAAGVLCDMSRSSSAAR